MRKVRYREPRRGELNHELQRLIKKAFKNARADVTEALSALCDSLKRLSRKWNVIETRIKSDVELVPTSGAWEPGLMAAFVEGVWVYAYRKRANGTVAEHKVGMVHWPHGYLGIEESDQGNPTMISIVDDPHHSVSARKKRKKA